MFVLFIASRFESVTHDSRAFRAESSLDLPIGLSVPYAADEIRCWLQHFVVQFCFFQHNSDHMENLGSVTGTCTRKCYKEQVKIRNQAGSKQPSKLTIEVATDYGFSGLEKTVEH
jgi:hypothetical protein